MTHFDADGDYAGDEMINADREYIQVFEDDPNSYVIGGLILTRKDKGFEVFLDGKEIIISMAQASVLGKWLYMRVREAAN